MYLKKYQIRVVNELKHFFQTAKTQKTAIDTAAKVLPENMRNSLNYVQHTFDTISKPYLDNCRNGLGQYYPRTSLKVPTGGGKTILAVEAIREYQTLFAERKTGLVVWIVPKETIYTQTVDRLRDKSHPYRQLLDLFATSVDYDLKSEVCQQFFQIVQNKLHYAVNKQTAAEIIYSRANAELPFMGMKTFSGEQPGKEEAVIAKNYLDEKELLVLNRMVSAFFDLAELHAINHDPIYMRDWLPQVDNFAERYGKGVLQSAGTVSRQAAIEKATDEYKKYRKRINALPTPVERDYLEAIKQAQKKLKND